MATSSDCRRQRFHYTEEEMGDAFQDLLCSRRVHPDLGSFNRVYREISCRQGVPDFIGVKMNRYFRKGIPYGIKGLVGPSVLSLLKPKSPRTLNYLIENSEFGEESIRKVIRLLQDTGQVKVTRSGSFHLSGSFVSTKAKVWSFELKLDNPKRAMFQAQQSRSFAERSIIVVPPGQEKNYTKFFVNMRRWHIGLAVFDIETNEFYFIRRGRSAKALSPAHKIYTLSQLDSVEQVV